jgi:hypothetical protein
MATRLRQPGAGFTNQMGDNLFSPKTVMPQGGGGLQAPAGQVPNIQGPADQTQPAQQPPQLPQVPLVGGGPLQTDVQRRQYNTDGYAQPNRIATQVGAAPVGWDAAKWADANHQTPKYVSGRLQAEAGDQKDPANRQKYLDAMKEAYGPENFQFNGKDKISIDGGKSFVDIWGGAGAGVYSNAWQDESSQQAGPAPGSSSGPAVQLRSLNPQMAASSSSSATQGSSTNPFASHPAGGVRLAGGEWVPGDHPLASGPKWAEPSGGPSGGPETAPAPTGGGMPAPGGPAAPEGAGEPGGPADSDPNSIQNLIKQMMSGDLNQDIVNRRVDGARDVLNKQRSSARDTLGASLAERGQLGSGAGESGEVRLDTALNDEFAMEVNDIFANEGENADKRLMSALGFGSAMETADKDRKVDQYNADTTRLNSDRDYDLGKGDLDVRRRSVDNDFDLGNRRLASDDALGNRRIDVDRELGNKRIDTDFGIAKMGDATNRRGQDIDWDKFGAQFGLDSEDLQNRIKQGDTQAILDLLRIMGGNTGTAAGGFY